MARKRLIKGANAVRVEERIARVPEDLGGESNIFRTLKALEDAPIRSPSPSLSPGTPQAAKPAPAPKKKTKPPKAESSRQATAGKRPARTGAKNGTPHRPPIIEAKAGTGEGPQSLSHAPTRPDEAQAQEAAPIRATVRGEVPKAPSPSRKHLGPEDFTAAERREIVRCCADYRNHLPIYLLAVQREVEVIDAVIEKCLGVEEEKGKGRK